MAASYSASRVTLRRDANKRVVVADITLSGTYTTGGDSLTASTSGIGLKKIEEFHPHGGAASDGTVQYPVYPVYAANGQSVSLKLFESGGAAGTAAAEKGNGESLTGITLRATIVGY